MSVRPEIHLIVARGSNGVIGDGDTMPWTLRDDLAYFKKATMGAPVVMGRRTWASIGRPLPGRRNVVLSRDPAYVLENADVVRSPEAAMELLEGNERIFIIGGGEIYRLFADQADVLHITDVAVEAAGTVTFPDIDKFGSWSVEEVARQHADERNDHDFVVRVYRRLRD